MVVPDISIVICTLNRPEHLEEALGSCLALRDIETYAVEIVVVDNSPDAVAEPIVARLSLNSPIEIRYVTEARLGIALARNAGVAAARAPLIAFVDDDMRLSPGWLGCVMRRMTKSAADALVCAIAPVAEDPRQRVDARALDIYRRDLDLSDGSPVRVKRSGHIPGAGAGNSVLRRATCIDSDEPFDPAFGNGGEDTDFFLRLGRQNAKVVWSADSLAYEIVSQRRTTMEFLTHGAVRGSRNLARALVKNSRWRAITKLMLLAIGVGQGLCRMACYGGLLLVRSEDADYMRLSAMRGFGKIPWAARHGSWWAMPR